MRIRTEKLYDLLSIVDGEEVISGKNIAVGRSGSTAGIFTLTRCPQTNGVV